MRGLAFLLLSFIAFACKKQEGIGGKGMITGKVYAIDMNNDFSKIQSEYYSGKEDVYIVYGNDDFYSDKVETHYDGGFKFEHLNPGDYTIYVYSKDSTESQDLVPVIVNTKVGKKEKEIVLEDIVIVKQ